MKRFKKTSIDAVEKANYTNEASEETKAKKLYPGFRKNLNDYFTEYSSNSGIHGFKYMGEQNRSIVEKFCWLLIFCISLYVCVDLIIKTYIKWNMSPVLVSLPKSPMPVWQIPFPAVTICSEIKMRRSDLDYTQAYHDLKSGKNFTEEELKKLSDLSFVCDEHIYTTGSKTIDFESVKFLMSIAPKFNKTFMMCGWTNLKESCFDLFSPILTEEGICYTFNMLDKSELFTNAVYFHEEDMVKGRKSGGWTLEDGYPKMAGKDTFPRRAISAGASAGLKLLLYNYRTDLDYICRGPVQGFKVLLHNPAEIPRVGTQYFRVPLNQDVVVSVKPDMMTTSDGLRQYDPHQRQCYFPGERNLYFFQKYTQQNCQVECLANYTLKKCGCVAFHMPHEESTNICGSGNRDCMSDADNELLGMEVEAEISSFESKFSQNTSDCNCLPSCTSLTYNAEISQADFYWLEMLDVYNLSSEFHMSVFTKITIFFKEKQFSTSERNQLYGQEDLLAKCGGILGLFTGFSFLSIVEIIYFLTLRLLCNIKRHGRHFWSGSDSLVKDDAYLHV